MSNVTGLKTGYVICARYEGEPDGGGERYVGRPVVKFLEARRCLKGAPPILVRDAAYANLFPDAETAHNFAGGIIDGAFDPWQDKAVHVLGVKRAGIAASIEPE